MASQGSQSSNSRVCLSLLKFSYATVAEGISAPIPWKHISSNGDLVVVLDTIEINGPAGAVEKRQRFRVLQSNDVLEDIDLDILAGEAQRSASQDQSAQHYRSCPLITVIVKLPCVAMRYPLAGGRVRRFQVRFSDDEAFYETMKRLSKAGVPFMESGSSTAQQTSSVSSHRGSILNGQQTVSHLHDQHRPSTATVYDYKTMTALNTYAEPLVRPSTSGLLVSHEQHPTLGRAQQPSTSQKHFGVDSPRFASHTDTGSEQKYISTDPRNETYLTGPPSISVPNYQEEDDTMPRKRELPFARKVKKNDNVVDVHSPQSSQPLAMPTSRAALGSDTTTPNTSTPTAVDQEQKPTKGAKRAASKPKKEPAPKKPRATKTQTKKASQEYQVPSVEELLRQKMAENDTQEHNNPAVSDTQDQVNRPDHRTQGQQSTQPTIETEPLESGSNPSLPRMAHSRIHAEMQNKNSKPRLHSDPRSLHTPKDQTPSSTPTPPQQNNIELPPPLPPTRSPQPAAPQVDNNNDPTKSTAFTTPITNKSQTHMHTHDKHHQSEPTSELSQQDKIRAIETWICQQMHDDDFIDVCKMVESVWVRAFVKY